MELVKEECAALYERAQMIKQMKWSDVGYSFDIVEKNGLPLPLDLHAFIFSKLDQDMIFVYVVFGI